MKQDRKLSRTAFYWFGYPISVGEALQTIIITILTLAFVLTATYLSFR
jgi:hypothetical protein